MKQSLFRLLAVTISCVVVYFVAVVIRSYAIYRTANRADPIVKGQMYSFSPLAGTEGQPNRVGVLTHHRGLKTNVKLDSRGFRVPMSYVSDRRIKRPALITFGCSYTFGDNCEAEDTYPFVLERKLSGTVFNAAQSGHGFAGMLAQGRKWVPSLKPDYCLVQFADWLIDRSKEPVTQSLFGKVTRPYFAKNKRGEVYIHEPAFTPATALIDCTEFFPPRDPNPSFVRFFVKAAFPIMLRDDFSTARFKVKTWLGLEDSLPNDEEIVSYVFSEFRDLSQKHGARLLVVVLKTPNRKMVSALAQSAFPGRLVFAQERMKKLVNFDPELYFQQYMFVKGSEIIDYHPNPKAHAVIADEIVSVMSKS